jgi:hypothetical protein
MAYVAGNAIFFPCAVLQVEAGGVAGQALRWTSLLLPGSLKHQIRGCPAVHTLGPLLVDLAMAALAIFLLTPFLARRACFAHGHCYQKERKGETETNNQFT